MLSWPSLLWSSVMLSRSSRPLFSCSERPSLSPPCCHRHRCCDRRCRGLCGHQCCGRWGHVVVVVMAIVIAVIAAVLPQSSRPSRSWLLWPSLSWLCCHSCCGRVVTCHSRRGHVVAVVAVIAITAVVAAIVVAVFVAVVPSSWLLSSLHRSRHCRSCCHHYRCHYRCLRHHVVVVGPLKGEWVGGRFPECADNKCQTAKDD